MLATIKGHTGEIRSISCSPAGRIIATVGADGTVKLWDQSAGREFDLVEGVDSVLPAANSYVKDSDDGVPTTLFDLSGNAPPLTVDGSQGVSPDGKTFATNSFDPSNSNAGIIKLWSVNPRQELATLRIANIDAMPTFSANGRLFTAIGSDRKSLILWDTVDRKELTLIRSDVEMGNYLVSPDGKVAVTVDKDGKRVKSWDVASQKQLAMFERNEKREAPQGDLTQAWITQKLLSPNGKLFAFSYSNEVMLWETSSEQEPVTLGKQESLVSILAFSPDGKLLAVGDNSGVVKIWDALTRKPLSTFKADKDGVTALGFSPDGRTLASGGKGPVKLYNMASMRELITLTHESSSTSDMRPNQGGEDRVEELFFSADGRSLFTLSSNHVLRIWRGAKVESVANTGQ